MDHASPTLGVVTMPAQALQQTGTSLYHTHQVQYLCKKLNYGSTLGVVTMPAQALQQTGTYT